MKTTYKLINDEVLTWSFSNTNDQNVSNHDIELMIGEYYNLCNKIPTHIYMHVEQYKAWMYHNETTIRRTYIHYIDTPTSVVPVLNTSFGPMTVLIKVMNKPEVCPVLIGTEIDFERNEVDMVFEDVVLTGYESI